VRKKQRIYGEFMLNAHLLRLYVSIYICI
jgi:hypothetical protein